MAVPLSYSFRNLRTRKLTTALTVGGMALVVFVFAAILMLANGLEKTLITTGSYDNVIVIRKGSGSEVASGIGRPEAAVVEMLPYVAVGADGERQVAKEILVLITLSKRGTGKPSNVVLRGIGEQSLILRPQVKIISGRLPRRGSSEIIVGQAIIKNFIGAGLHEKLKFGMREWQIVGVFDAQSTGFSSEIWGDADQFMQAFRRPVYSSVLFRLKNSSEFDAAKPVIESDPRLTLEAKRETRYYLDQSEIMAKFLRILGISLTIVFSVGAVIGAMITMYTAVANRVSEIGTLRALGFQRSGILLAFLAESLFLGFFGGVIGLFFASFMQFVSISTVNFNTFAELAFGFDMSADIIVSSMIFALLMGFFGGFLPALRASKMNIVDALRAM
jgi:ABC-type antimicrobial peptide transport system permease subunit